MVTVLIRKSRGSSTLFLIQIRRLQAFHHPEYLTNLFFEYLFSFCQQYNIRFSNIQNLVPSTTLDFFKYNLKSLNIQSVIYNIICSIFLILCFHAVWSDFVFFFSNIFICDF